MGQGWEWVWNYTVCVFFFFFLFFNVTATTEIYTLSLHDALPVLAGWKAGYLDGESWRMNSGVDFIVDHKDEVHFHGRSGSNYICGKGQYGMRRNGSSIFERMTKDSESMDIDVELLDEDTDWINLLG